MARDFVTIDDVENWENLAKYAADNYDKSVEDWEFGEWGPFTQYAVMFITEKGEEVLFDGFDGIKEAVEHIKESAEEQNGWTADSVWHNDKQVNLHVQIDVAITEEESE